MKQTIIIHCFNQTDIIFLLDIVIIFLLLFDLVITLRLYMYFLYYQVLVFIHYICVYISSSSSSLCRAAKRISLTLSRHFSQSFIAFGRSSGLLPVSSHSCCMYVRAGRPAFAWPYAGVHRSTSLMSSSLLLQQCPACLVRLPCIVFVMGGKWPYSWCLVGCCR